MNPKDLAGMDQAGKAMVDLVETVYAPMYKQFVESGVPPFDAAFIIARFMAHVMHPGK